jgi:thioesterase domain-containing protein/acyl carrier protein
MINRAGSKIAPLEVDEVLLGHPAVAQAVTFSIPHATLGEEVAAAVVLRKDSVATAEQVRKHAARHLVEFKVPKRVVIVDEIPKGPTGKLQRFGLAERLGLVASGSQARRRPAGSAAPRTTTEKTLAAIWSEILKLPDIGVDANFFEIGGDSLLATGLCLRVSEVFGISPDLTQFFEIPTIAGQAHVLEESERIPLSPCLVRIQSSGHNPPFFCVTAGTEVAYLGNLGRHLAPDQPLYALTPTALVDRQGGYTPERAAVEYIREIRAVQTEGPYFLGGWCSGATVALEVARGLVNLDQEVALLTVFAPMLYPHYGHSLRSYWQSVSSLPLGEALHRILRTLLGIGRELRQGIGRRFSRKALEAPVPTPASPTEVSAMVQDINRRSFFRLSRKSYPGRVTLFLTKDAMGGTLPNKDPTVVFGKLAASGLNVHVVSGDHNTVVDEPHVRDLAQQFRHCLDDAYILAKKIKKS